MSSGIRQPFHWEDPLPALPAGFVPPCPVLLPESGWRDRRQRNDEHPMGRTVIADMAQRYVDHTATSDNPMTPDEGVAAASRHAHRYDHRNR